MDWHELTLVFGALLMTLFGVVLKTLWDATQKLTNDLRALETALPDKYVRRDDFAAFRDELMQVLSRIEQKLDGKADKQ